MKAEVVQIQWHRSQPVTSVDFSPRVPGRLASSGGDSYVRIWDTRGSTPQGGSAADSSQDAASSDSTVASASIQFRSTLAGHTSGVNVVRWSPQQIGDELLASGDNSGAIIIWKQVQRTMEALRNISIDEDTETYKETWRQCKLLTGHKDEVSDLAWAPCGRFLASVGTDQRLRVWDVRRGEVIGTAHNHSEVVQGVTWDPTGSYIATQSFDRYVNIYTVLFARIAANRIAAILTCVQRSSRIESPAQPKGDQISKEADPSADLDQGELGTTTQPKLALAATTTRLYNDPTSAGMSFFRRPSFSPDGRLLACPAAVFEGRHAVMIYTRAGLSRGPAASLAGQAAPAWVVRFSPRCYVPRKEADGAPVFGLDGYRMLLAVGTDDALVIYDSQHAYPLASVRNMHLYRYQDIAWSADGLQLVAASHDGYCTLVSFVADEFGEPLEVNAAGCWVPAAADATTLAAATEQPAADPSNSGRHCQYAPASITSKSIATSSFSAPAAAAVVVAQTISTSTTPAETSDTGTAISNKTSSEGEAGTKPAVVRRKIVPTPATFIP